MSKPLPLKIAIVGENGLVFLLSALLPQDHELLKPCRCRMTTSRVSRPGHRREGFRASTVNFGVTGPSQSLRSSADFLGQSTQSILVEVNERQVPIRLSRGWNVSCVGANALSALRGPMASAIHANPAVSAWATIANNRAS